MVFAPCWSGKIGEATVSEKTHSRNDRGPVWRCREEANDAGYDSGQWNGARKPILVQPEWVIRVLPFFIVRSTLCRVNRRQVIKTRKRLLINTLAGIFKTIIVCEVLVK